MNGAAGEKDRPNRFNLSFMSIDVCIRNCVISLVLLIAGCSQATREADPQTNTFAFASSSAEAEQPSGIEAGTDRKIIYEAELRLVVQDFSKTETDLPAIVRKHGGYLANVTIDRTSGQQRRGRWQARIPVDQFEVFMLAVSDLGIPESRGQKALDVTEEYVDLEARITNKQRLEERILNLLERAEGSIKDVIEVEQELGRVRGEIEQMQGRLRYLANRTQLATVDIIASEQRDYIPPESPALPARIRHAWDSSLLLLRGLGEAAAVAIVFAFPWLMLSLIVMAPIAWVVRRKRQRSRTSNNGH